MDNFTKEDIERKKKEIYDSMGKRSRKYIDKIGFENWNPFEEPKDPLDIRKDISKRTVNDLVNEFMITRREEKTGVAFAEGVHEMALALMAGNDKYRGMFEYARWYYELLESEGHELE